MTGNSHVSSERGIALIVVLLLMMVLSGLATGFAVTGQIEGQMGRNEMYFAGARAAAEAGLNRAIVEITADNTTNWIKGVDNAADVDNLAAASNADNGSLDFKLGAGPHFVDSKNEYFYDVQILDDDNPELYQTPLTSEQLTRMHEPDGNIYSNTNDRLILRSIGYGPHGTVVKLARILESVDTEHITLTDTPTVSNPAIIINGDLELNGGITIQGDTVAHARFGTVHANGNLAKTGTSGTVTGDVTASGTYTVEGDFTPGGSAGGGRPSISVPDIHASNYAYLADYKLTTTSTGAAKIQTQSSAGVWTDCTSGPCTTALADWTISGGYWNLSSSPTANKTYLVDGSVDIGTTSGGSNRAVSVLATGNINVHGNAKLSPGNTAQIQFVADGDLKIDNGSDLDPPVNVDGQILIRGQFDAGGNMEFQGRVMVQDVAGAGSLVDSNKLHGNVKFTYGGSLGDISGTMTTSTTTTTYTNNVSGWIEQ